MVLTASADVPADSMQYTSAIMMHLNPLVPAADVSGLCFS